MFLHSDLCAVVCVCCRCFLGWWVWGGGGGGAGGGGGCSVAVFGTSGQTLFRPVHPYTVDWAL